MESSYLKRNLVIPAKAGIQRYAAKLKSGSPLSRGCLDTPY